LTACSALAVLFVKVGNQDHSLMYITKVIEGVASSFITPCLAALTLANYGGEQFDHVMANNLLWGHVGSALSAILAGLAAYVFYPNIKSCFYVIGISALCAVYCVRYLPEGDVNMGRGLVVLNDGNEMNENNNKMNIHDGNDGNGDDMNGNDTLTKSKTEIQEQEVATYMTVLLEPKTLVLGLTGFFFHLSNANVLLVLGELMSQNEDANADGQGGGYDDYVENYYENATSRSAIPLIAGAILLAQATMTIATYMADYYTNRGMGRKILFTLGLMTLPVRCALLIYWKDAGNAFLLSTQILDGLGGGLFNIVHPFLVADITFGTGRFNLIMGLTASCFGFGATLSNLLGQHLVEHMGHVASLAASLVVSFIPIAIFTIFMPETWNTRGQSDNGNGNGDNKQCVAMTSTAKNSNSRVITQEYHQLA
jgi:MFS family permease